MSFLSFSLCHNQMQQSSKETVKTQPKLATIVKVNLARKFVHSHIKVMLRVMAFTVALTKMIAKLLF